MTWVVNDKEFEAVSNLPAPKRYEHFVKRVADFEEVWALKTEDGWCLLGTDEGKDAFPVWPNPRYAEAYAEGDWADASPEAIPLSAWLDKWLPGLEADGTLVAVFPTASGKGVVVEPERLQTDLREELARYE